MDVDLLCAIRIKHCVNPFGALEKVQSTNKWTGPYFRVCTRSGWAKPISFCSFWSMLTLILNCRNNISSLFSQCTRGRDDMTPSPLLQIHLYVLAVKDFSVGLFVNLCRVFLLHTWHTASNICVPMFSYALCSLFRASSSHNDFISPVASSTRAHGKQRSSSSDHPRASKIIINMIIIFQR